MTLCEVDIPHGGTMFPFSAPNLPSNSVASGSVMSTALTSSTGMTTTDVLMARLAMLPGNVGHPAFAGRMSQFQQQQQVSLSGSDQQEALMMINHESAQQRNHRRFLAAAQANSRLLLVQNFQEANRVDAGNSLLNLTIPSAADRISGRSDTSMTNQQSPREMAHLHKTGQQHAVFDSDKDEQRKTPSTTPLSSPTRSLGSVASGDEHTDDDTPVSKMCAKRTDFVGKISPDSSTRLSQEPDERLGLPMKMKSKQRSLAFGIDMILSKSQYRQPSPAVGEDLSRRSETPGNKNDDSHMNEVPESETEESAQEEHGEEDSPRTSHETPLGSLSHLSRPHFVACDVKNCNKCPPHGHGGPLFGGRGGLPGYPHPLHQSPTMAMNMLVNQHHLQNSPPVSFVAAAAAAAAASTSTASTSTSPVAHSFATHPLFSSVSHPHLPPSAPTNPYHSVPPGADPTNPACPYFVYNPPTSSASSMAFAKHHNLPFGSLFFGSNILGPDSPYQGLLRIPHPSHLSGLPQTPPGVPLHPGHHHPHLGHHPMGPGHHGLLPGLPHHSSSVGLGAGLGGGASAHSKRKRSWSRAVFSNLQRKGLEKRFQMQKYITKPDRRQLAATLGLTDAQVKVWFQNRRMKWRHSKEGKAESEKAESAVVAAAISSTNAIVAKGIPATSGSLSSSGGSVRKSHTDGAGVKQDVPGVMSKQDDERMYVSRSLTPPISPTTDSSDEPISP